MQEPTRENLEGGWELTPGQDAPALPTSSAATAPNRRNRQFLNNLFINTKSKLYNLYRPMCKTLPNFSGSPIYMLGVCYRPTPTDKLQKRHKTGQAPQKPEAAVAPQTAASSYSPYAFFYMYSSTKTSPSTSTQPSPQPVRQHANLTGHEVTAEFEGEEEEEEEEEQLDTSRRKAYDDDEELVPYESPLWEGQPSNVKDFLRDFQSRPWFTYRNQFPTIGPTTYTTDMGWGCMLRTGQMMLAQCLMCHLFGRDWRMHPYSPRDVHNFRALIRLFADEPLAKSPYSIHNIAQTAATRFHKKVGEWFEPTVLAHTIRVLVEKQRSVGMKVYVPRDPIIYRQDVEALCRVFRPSSGESTPLARSLSSSSSSSLTQSLTSSTTAVVAAVPSSPLPTPSPSPSPSPSSIFNSALRPAKTSPSMEATDRPGSSGKPGIETSPSLSTTTASRSTSIPLSTSLSQEFDGWTPVFIVVPVRLGIQELNPVYIPALKRFMTLRQSVGIVGGKPHSSYYFVGYQDDNILYLDPHVVNPAVKMEDNFPVDSFHTDIPQSMFIGEIDPSLALGFYCASRADFEDLCKNVVKIGEDTECVFSIGEKNPERPEVVDVSRSCPAVLHGYGDDDDAERGDGLDPDDEDDLVFL